MALPANEIEHRVVEARPRLKTGCRACSSSFPRSETQIGRKTTRLTHSSASVAVQIRIRSSATCRTPRCCGTTRGPGLRCARTNSPKCRGMAEASRYSDVRRATVATRAPSAIRRTRAGVADASVQPHRVSCSPQSFLRACGFRFRSSPRCPVFLHPRADGPSLRDEHLRAFALEFESVRHSSR